jgi:hypothetical protein
MPYTNPAQCVGDCAVESARYLQAVLKGNTIIDEQSGDTEVPGDGSQNIPDDSIVAGENYQQLCESCHKTANVKTEFANWKLTGTDELARYVELTMPFANASACIGDCAAETAQYIMSVLDDETDNSGNPQEPDETEQEPVITVPTAPSSVQATMAGDAVRVVWSDNSDNEDSFTIWRQLDTGAWSALQSLAANVTQYTDSSVPESMIRYRVSAKNSAGVSQLSASATIDLTPVSGGEMCSAANYVAGTTYLSGQTVQNLDRFFECKTAVSGWCSSSAAWAYEPGKGLYWEEAWTELENCETNDNVEEEVLNAPTLISETLTDNQVALVWLDNASKETSYVVEKSVDGGAYIELIELPADSETYIDSDNQAGTSVQYRIYAQTQTKTGNKLTSSIHVFVEVQFDANAYYAEDCAACHGARGEGVANSSFTIAPFNESGLSVSELADAIDKSMPLGNVTACQGDCAQATAQYIADEFMQASNVPAAVNNIFIGANAQQTLINISWSDNSENETGFSIERKVDAGSFVNWKSVGANVTSTSDADVVVGSQYQYRITAFNESDVSLMTVSSVLLLEQTVTLPIKPSNLAVVMNDSSAKLTWQDNSTNEDNFVIQKRKNKGDWSADIIVAANVVTFMDADVEYGNIYDFRVLATNTAGDSSWTDEVNLDLTLSENRQAYEENCAGCHKDGGIAVDLLNDFTKQSWANNDWDSFVSKVNTMPVSNCDADCINQAASYVWVDNWGFAQSEEIAASGRGVRGVRLLTSYEYLNTVQDVFGVTIPDSRLPADRQASGFKYASDAHSGIVVYDRLNEFLLLAEYVAEQANPSSYGCATACSDAQLLQLLSYAFRRNIDSAMLAEYKSFQSQYGRDDLIASILLSPWFLYRSELGQWDASKDSYQLDDFEVATALSYQLWGTTPNEALLAKAKNGLLSSASQIEAEAQSMMNDSKAAQHLVEFVKYYTNTQANIAEKPNLTLDMISAMETEREQSVIHALTTGSATMDELFNPGYTFVNASLSSHYNISGGSSNAFTKVNTPDQRGGLLHQGILQVHNSDFTATSLVKRGKMIRENLMCHEMGVPSGVDPSSVTLPSEPISTRERWDIITGPNASEGQCWSCHQLMNEPGSVLESFDAAGRYRVTEAAYNDASVSVSIETAGVLRSNDATELLLSYGDARDLSEYLAQSPVGMDCFVDNYARFTTGYEVDGQLKADFDQVAKDFRAGGEIWPMILNTVTAESFLYRTDRSE